MDGWRRTETDTMRSRSGGTPLLSLMTALCGPASDTAGVPLRTPVPALNAIQAGSWIATIVGRGRPDGTIVCVNGLPAMTVSGAVTGWTLGGLLNAELPVPPPPPPPPQPARTSAVQATAMTARGRRRV